MAVYAAAMYCYAAELAFGPRVRKSEPALVAANGPEDTSYDDAGVAVEQRDDRSGKAERLGRIAVSLTVLAFGLHLASVVARGVSAGRPPWGNMFEFSVTGALAVTGSTSCCWLAATCAISACS